jgi:CheY-like chemotaxis protein
MENYTDFVTQVTSAYRHLYDFVQLRTHPLADALIDTSKLTPKERSWELHQLLLDIIDELSLGESSPTNSGEWRRHKLMVMRYVNALEPQQVADQLSISRRQYYREHSLALETLAEILWERRRKVVTMTPTERSEMLQVEMVRLSQNEQRAPVIEVLESVLALLRKLMDDNAIHARLFFPLRLPVVAISRSVLRQVLMSILGTLAKEMQEAVFEFSTDLSPSELTLAIKIVSTGQIPAWEGTEWYMTVHDMLAINQGSLTVKSEHSGIWTFALTLPLSREHTILAIDDNIDMLALYERYLTPHGYRVLTAQTADVAFDFVRLTQPFAILLDLMMPDHDGWELLQSLVTQAATTHIQVIVCSVLNQRDLALRLGASGFIQKPVTEQSLLSVLSDLQQSPEYGR